MTSFDIGRFNGKRLLVYGDFMVDEYVIGSVERISPEAPVPVLRVSERQRKLGGAGNVVDNLMALGASVKAFGFVGDDEAGTWALSAMRGNGVDVSEFVQSDEVVTTVKTRYVSRGQQFLRCDEEEPIDAELIASACDSTSFDAVLSDIDAVLISDYAKGAVTHEACIRLIRAASKKGIPIIVDPKGSDYSKYQGATGCTPNLKELADCTGSSLKNEDDELKAAQGLLNAFDFDYVFLTRSEKGISLFVRDGGRFDYPAQKKEVIDVSGAGDTVACVITLGLAAGMDPGSSCQLANLAASVACSKFGTSTVTASELSRTVRGDAGSKVVTLEEAAEAVEKLREAGKKVVFTNGCFDLLHYGHLTSFDQARAQGDALIVAVNSDASVRRLKGPNRPIINEHDRLGLIAALSCIDYVLLMEDDNPESIIKVLKPDVIVKGKDWEATGVPEAAIVESYGGSVKYIDMAAGLSTTNIIDRVVSRYGEAD